MVQFVGYDENEVLWIRSHVSMSLNIFLSPTIRQNKLERLYAASIIFVKKARAYLRILHWVLALQTNNGLAWKNVTQTNTLAYFGGDKSVETSTVGQCLLHLTRTTFFAQKAPPTVTICLMFEIIHNHQKKFQIQQISMSHLGPLCVCRVY